MKYRENNPHIMYNMFSRVIKRRDFNSGNIAGKDVQRFLNVLTLFSSRLVRLVDLAA